MAEKKVKEKRTRSKIGKASRDKGKRGERKVAEMLRARGFPASRGVQYKGGMNSPDVVCEALKFLNFEVKWVESLNLAKAMNQSTQDSGGEKIPTVVHKKSRTTPLITMRFTDFIDIMQWAINDLDSYNQLELDRDEIRMERGRTEQTEEIDLI